MLSSVVFCCMYEHKVNFQTSWNVTSRTKGKSLSHIQISLSHIMRTSHAIGFLQITKSLVESYVTTNGQTGRSQHYIIGTWESIIWNIYQLYCISTGDIQLELCIISQHKRRMCGMTKMSHYMSSSCLVHIVHYFILSHILYVAIHINIWIISSKSPMTNILWLLARGKNGASKLKHIIEETFLHPSSSEDERKEGWRWGIEQELRRRRWSHELRVGNMP